MLKWIRKGCYLPAQYRSGLKKCVAYHQGVKKFVCVDGGLQGHDLLHATR